MASSDVTTDDIFADPITDSPATQGAAPAHDTPDGTLPPSNGTSASADHTDHNATAQAESVAAEKSARHLGIGLLVGIIGAILVYGQYPALGFALFAVVLVASLFLNARAEGIHPVRKNITVLLPILGFFAAMIVIRADDTLMIANLGCLTLAGLLLVHYFRNGNILKQDLFSYAFATVITSVIVWFQPIDELVHGLKWFQKRPKGWLVGFGPVIRGLIITIPVVLIFVVLLSSADAVFANLVGDIFKLFRFPDFGDLTGYAVMGGLLAYVAVGGYGIALAERKTKRDEDAPATGFVPKNTGAWFSLGPTETTMLLGSVCAVFAAFVAVQFRYLFGGAGNIDVTKFNYADYVHRGFAELVIVGVLTLGLAFVLNATAVRKTPAQNNLFRGLVTVLVLLTGVILMSAFQRMRLYEETYGFTSLRLAVYIFILWLGFLFAGFTLSLYWEPRTVNVFGVACLVAVFGYFATLDLIDPDAFVAREMAGNHDVDPMYALTLTNEAVPAMVAMYKEARDNGTDPGLKQVIGMTLARRYNILTATPYTDLRSFTVGNAVAIAAINEVKSELPKFDTRYESAVYPESAFDSIKKGMTYRAIIRQYGFPFSTNYGYDSASYRDVADIGDQRGQLIVQYELKEGGYMVLYVDTADGLSYACVGENASTCTPVLK